MTTLRKPPHSMTQTTLDQKNNGYYLWLYFIAFLRKPKARVLGMPIKCPLPPRLSSRVGQSITTCRARLEPNIQIPLYSTIPNPLLYSSSIHHHGKYPSALRAHPNIASANIRPCIILYSQIFPSTPSPLSSSSTLTANGSLQSTITPRTKLFLRLGSLLSLVLALEGQEWAGWSVSRSKRRLRRVCLTRYVVVPVRPPLMESD